MDRFWEKVLKREGDACWDWIGAKKENGYGVFRISKTEGMEYAHRFSFRLAFGQIPEGMYVCHSCDNRSCVNPNHLWAGTARDNQRDMAAKGRTYSPAKRLDDTTIALIRLEAQTRTQREVAELFGVARSYVSRIANNVRRAGV